MVIMGVLRFGCTAWLLSSTAVLASSSSSASSSEALELTTATADEEWMRPINFGLLVDSDPEPDRSVAFVDAAMTLEDSTSSLTSSSSSTTTASTTTTTTSSSSSSSTTTTTEDNNNHVEMVEFWPFHKKNKTVHPDDDDNKHNKTKDETCAAQHDCSACAVHSRMCHWCAHDNACHSIGSIYGCITGVNCFSNDRCKRTEPDAIPNVNKYPRMGVVPMVVALVLAGIALCCVSFGYCLACGIKGAYDDLAEIAAMESRPFVVPIHALTTVDTTMTPRAAHTAAAAADQDAETQEEGHASGGAGIAAGGGANSNANYMRMDDEDAETSPLLLTAAPAQKSRRIPRHMQRCFNACTLCYIATITILGTLVFGTVHYYPKIPEYSVCSDQVAWKSLIDSIAAIKVDASFEILVSVANPNVVDAVLDLGKGTFKHNNAFVGTFEIPPARVPALSISDLMIIARFTPEKYEALAIVEEYYRGKLILHVDAQASIRVPFLLNYTYEVDVKDMIVNANEKDDRSLCKCPTWDDLKNNTKLMMTLQLPSMMFQT